MLEPLFLPIIVQKAVIQTAHHPSWRLTVWSVRSLIQEIRRHLKCLHHKFSAELGNTCIRTWGCIGTYRCYMICPPPIMCKSLSPHDQTKSSARSSELMRRMWKNHISSLGGKFVARRIGFICCESSPWSKSTKMHHSFPDKNNDDNK